MGWCERCDIIEMCTPLHHERAALHYVTSLLTGHRYFAKPQPLNKKEEKIDESTNQDTGHETLLRTENSRTLDDPTKPTASLCQ